MQEDTLENDELEIITDEDKEGSGEERQLAEQVVLSDGDEEAEGNEDELENYSESVQRRIRKLTGKYREEERQRNAAVEYAEAVKKQNDELQSRLNKLDESYVGEFGTRLESQVLSAKEAYKKAHEEGDADAMFDAQQNISRLAMEQARYDQIKRREVSEPDPAPQQVQQQVHGILHLPITVSMH